MNQIDDFYFLDEVIWAFWINWDDNCIEIKEGDSSASIGIPYDFSMVLDSHLSQVDQNRTWMDESWGGS